MYGLQTTQDPPTSVGLRARESDNLLRFDLVFSANMSFDLVAKTTIFIIAFQRKYHDAKIGRFHHFDCSSTRSCCDHICRRGFKVESCLDQTNGNHRKNCECCPGHSSVSVSVSQKSFKSLSKVSQKSLKSLPKVS